MTKLEDLKPNTTISGILPDAWVSVVNVRWYGSDVIELVYKDASGVLANKLLYRDDEGKITIIEKGRPWSFDGGGHQFRLVSEAHRIRLAHLFDPVLAIHTSLVEPLPHQITAVYESMLPRQPLRFLLADDPGAGKTIMAGILIKELMARGDLHRCLIVSPGALAEQWQDEMYQRFHLPFEILTHDKLEAARTGNWFMENDLVIARLDKLSRNEDVQKKLDMRGCSWDLIIFDEAHKLSATFFSGEIKYTKRYRLGQLLGTKTRHLLLMTATPHNGREEDFQLFLALLDSDRFEGRFRDGVHQVDVTDLMRRMVKEQLMTFDGRPLFPERKAHTIPYDLSPMEAGLYDEVTTYVKEEFNRAENLDGKRRGTVGFALTILQRRLASSPAAIHQSLFRRRKRLEKRMSEIQTRSQGLSPGSQDPFVVHPDDRFFDTDDLEDLEDAPGQEVEEVEEEILDAATASQTIHELEAEINTLSHLEALALRSRNSGEDRKWQELSTLLTDIFHKYRQQDAPSEDPDTPSSLPGDRPAASSSQKLVIFTEHRDTLQYLEDRITTLLGRRDTMVIIHGGMGREDRLKAQEAFRHDPRVRILLATDAAGEGINLQRAHLMVNYDLPWNPNRLEQRFGRIHRIGQTEVCHLWNLVANRTREGDVYRTLLEKLEQARRSLGGQVFDVLGKLHFEGKALRDLLIEAVRYGESPEVRARLLTIIENAVDQSRLQDLIEERALAHDVMDTAKVARVREGMERAEARRLQPHFIESFFLEAFGKLGGTVRQREPRRYQISHVPAIIRNRDREMGIREPVLPRYERIAFEKSLVAPPGEVPAAFVCPGHPLLDATMDLTLERDKDLLRRGTVLVDTNDPGVEPGVILYLEHVIRDATRTLAGDQRAISKRMLYVRLDAGGNPHHLHYAPYLDYRPLEPGEPNPETILAQPECSWITDAIEHQVMEYAVSKVVPEHLDEVRTRREAYIEKTRAAVQSRLTKEIQHWDHRAGELKAKESAGKVNVGLPSKEAARRADELQARLRKRMEQLELERRVSAMPPVVIGGMIVVPVGLLARIAGTRAEPEDREVGAKNTQAAAARARSIVMEIERGLGFEPVDREFDKVGYDIESRDPATGKLRFIEVKGRITSAETVTITKNEILYSLNRPEDYILALVEFMDDGTHRVHYVRRPFRREPDFGVTSVNYTFSELMARGEVPR